MERSHVFIAGIVLVLLLTITIVIGAIQVASSRPAETKGSNTEGYAAFSNPNNVFESLRSNSDSSSSSIQTNGTQSGETPEQLLAIQNIIQIWETRAGSSDARIARESLAVVEQKTPEQIEKEEITSLFNDLIGTKITDKLAQQSNLTETNGETIWLGGYNSNTQITTGDDPQTDAQLALHAYGNQLGSLLKTFGISNGDQAGILDTFIKNRENTSGLQRLTTNYVKLALDIGAFSAPAQLTFTHEGLQSSYTSVGELLWDLSAAQSDEELLQKMLTYNKASEEVAMHHVTLVTLFKAHNISFKSSEAGNIFMFSPPTRK